MNQRRTGYGSRGAGSWVKRLFRRMPVWLVCVLHALALGVALLLYALPHHVIPRSAQSIGVVSTRGGAVVTATQAPAETQMVAEATPMPDATPEPTPEPTPDVKVGDFREALAGHFSDGEVSYTDTSYESGNVNISLSTYFSDEAKAQVYMADIYIADISCLKTAFSQDKYGRGYTEWIEKVAKRMDAVITMNGDYYGTRDAGVIIRNGTLYRDNPTTRDTCVLYWDGHMEMFSPDTIDGRKEIERGAYQSWCFGPSLLDGNGEPLGVFNADYGVTKKNPRSAIGYYEPGHYCFVTVDGRNQKSRGASVAQLARIMAGYGCKLAYNLDGGQTSLMWFGPSMVNDPSDGGRSSSDYILIVDQVTD